MNRIWSFLWNVLQHVGRFIFITTPIWFYRNVIREAVRQIWSAFERFIRENVLWVIFCSVFFLLVYFEQHEALHILLAIAVMIFGFKIMFKGFGKKK